VENYYFSPEWRDDVIREAKAELTELMRTAGITGETHIEVGAIPDAVVE
jgi:hypothetical protein